MGRGRLVAVGIAAFILGIAAICLSFAAYHYRIKIEDVSLSSLNGHCLYPNTPAFALGIVAAICLLIEQILISAGCFWCRGDAIPSKFGVLALIIFILSWMSFIIAFMGLIYTTIVNNSSFLATAYPGTRTVTETLNNVKGTAVFCYVGKENLFIWAAISCLIRVFLGLFSYLLLDL